LEEYTQPDPKPLLDRNQFIRENLVPADRGRRFGNLVIDTIVIYVVQIFIGVVYGVIVALVGALYLIEDDVFLNIFSFGIGITSTIMIYTLFEYKTGKTIGKMITKTRVVTEDGFKPTFSKALGRSFARLIPFEAFSGFSSSGLCWHDSLTNTMVIDDRNYFEMDVEKQEDENPYQIGKDYD